MTPRPFRFGAKAKVAADGHVWAELARAAEGLGYASFQIDDHLGNQLAAMPAIMAAACATTSILVGPHVAAADFRNPVIFAKECATIDVLSGGRFMLGIGAGWSAGDYASAGIHQDDARTRIDRLADYVTIVRGMWGAGPFTFEGEHLAVREVEGLPKPHADIPVLIGGGGPRILEVAAKHADIVGINPKIVGRSINPRSMLTAAAEAVDERIEWVRTAAGDRFDSLELQLQIFRTVVTDRPLEAADELGRLFGLPAEFILSAPFFQVGSVDQIAENLQSIRERWGINYIVFQAEGTVPMGPVVARLAGT